MYIFFLESVIDPRLRDKFLSLEISSFKKKLGYNIKIMSILNTKLLLVIANGKDRIR
jgi:hypothetical protein